jgi:hypothetical protein
MEADAEAIRRELRKALEGRDNVKLKRLRAQLVAVEAGHEPEPPAEVAATPEPQQLQGPGGTGDNRAPSFPPPEAVAEMRNLGGVLAGVLGAGLKSTRYTLEKPILVEDGGELKEVNAQVALGNALAPVLAKYLPRVLATPEGNLVAVAVAIWAAPAMQHGAEVLGLVEPVAPVALELPPQVGKRVEPASA